MLKSEKATWSKITYPGRSMITYPGRSKITYPGRSKITYPGRSKITYPGKSKITDPGRSKMFHLQWNLSINRISLGPIACNWQVFDLYRWN